MRKIATFMPVACPRQPVFVASAHFAAPRTRKVRGACREGKPKRIAGLAGQLEEKWLRSEAGRGLSRGDLPPLIPGHRRLEHQDRAGRKPDHTFRNGTNHEPGQAGPAVR